MESISVEIYSVVGCDLDYSTDDGDVCIYIIELRTYYCNVNEIDDNVYKYVDDFFEHTGTIQELFEIQQEGEDIFLLGNIDEKKFVYDGGVYQKRPIDDGSNFNEKWGSEEFFISKEDALKHYKGEIEFAKNRKHSAGIDVNLLCYYSTPR